MSSLHVHTKQNKSISQAPVTHMVSFLLTLDPGELPGWAHTYGSHHRPDTISKRAILCREMAQLCFIKSKLIVKSYTETLYIFGTGPHYLINNSFEGISILVGGSSYWQNNIKIDSVPITIRQQLTQARQREKSSLFDTKTQRKTQFP